MVLTVHHLDNSRSLRIVWLLEELEVPFEIKRYERNSENFLAQQDLKDLHPLGRSPVITDGEYTVAESGAIIEYLIEEYGKGRLRPPAADKNSRIQYNFFLHYAEGSFISPIILRFYVRAMTPREVSDNMVGTFLEPELHKHLKFLEGELQHSNYFAGTEFTAADIQITFVLEMVEVLFPVAKQYPKLGKFLETVQARPAYKQALDKTGRYQLSDFSPVLN